MNYPVMIVKSAFRNRFRTLLTIIAMGIAVLGFVFLRTITEIWNSGISGAAEDRLATRHKISITLDLPRTHYYKIIDQVPDITAMSYANWMGSIYPKDEHAFFANFAVDAETYFSVYPEIYVPDDQIAAWKSDPMGAIVGHVLAQKYNWKVGDTIILRGTIYPGDWRYRISGIYTSKNKAFDNSSFLCHWKYLNDGVPESRKERIGWLGIRVKDASKGPSVSRAIDALFASSDAETLTESERAFNLSFISMYSAIFTAIDVVSFVILLIMTMIVGNTIAMGVRERTHEYGILRSIGFKPFHLTFFVFGETLCIAALGGAIGVTLAIPLINGFGKVIEDNLGSFFPYFAVSPSTIVLASALSLIVGCIAALFPAIEVYKISIVNALRRVG